MERRKRSLREEEMECWETSRWEQRFDGGIQSSFPLDWILKDMVLGHEEVEKEHALPPCPKGCSEEQLQQLPYKVKDRV